MQFSSHSWIEQSLFCLSKQTHYDAAAADDDAAAAAADDDDDDDDDDDCPLVMRPKTPCMAYSWRRVGGILKLIKC